MRGPISRTHLFLVGFLSAGKTTVGQRLAQVLDIPFYDLDVVIQRRLGKPIEQVLAEEGEAFYRALEAETLREVCQAEFAVVALGAGTITHPASRQFVREHGVVVWLKATADELWRRTAQDERWPRLLTPSVYSHGLPGTDALKERLEGLLGLREPYYELADITVETTGLNVDEVVQQIVGKLQERELIIGQDRHEPL